MSGYPYPPAVSPMVTMPYKDKVSVYSSAPVTTADKNVVPASLALVQKNVPCNIHRGSAQAAAQADKTSPTGVYDGLAAMVYFPVSAYALLADRSVLVDNLTGDAFVIAGRPILRNLYPATAHVRCLVKLLIPKPIGL